MILQFKICIVNVCLILFASCEIMRPRGVPLSKVSLYDPSVDFTCFDGLRTLPFKYVNDDYCDCNDGTDEPGTSACPNGLFHCTNAGYKPKNIPSSRVNDGICDCCDASDEYLTGNCTDVCYTMGIVARQEAKKQAELVRQGNEVRQQLIAKSKQIKQEKRERIHSLGKDRAEAEAVKKEKEKLKVEAEAGESVALEAYRLIEEAEKEKKLEEERNKEKQEAMEQFMRLDSNMDNKISLSELSVRHTFDQNKDGAVSSEELKFFMGDLEEVDWDEFLSTVYPKMKPQLMMEKGLFQPPIDDKHESTPEVPRHSVSEPPEWDKPNLMPDRKEDEDEESEHGEEEEFDEHATDGEDDDIEGDKTEGEDQQEVGEEEEKKSNYDDETQQLIDEADKARAEFESADRAVRDIDRELNQLEEALSKDYGPEDEFLALDGECYELTDREYTYKLCPFDQVSQKPRSGGIETRLGTWKSWVGQGGHTYSAMMYDNGQACWNGPQRSSYVDVICGLENAVTAASEPNRCEYRFTFTTPAACKPQETHNTVPHDEL